MARNNRNTASDRKRDASFLFTWKASRWPHSELRKLVDAFVLQGFVQDSWRCIAHRQARPGDRAYLLKQGRPIGIFGIGRVASTPAKNRVKIPGRNPWYVQLRFDASLGDVLVDPEERFLVSEDQLMGIQVPKSRWRTQAAGVTLESSAAREIDEMAFDSLRIGGQGFGSADEDILRQRRLLELATRPKQQAFRDDVRRNYRDRCAVTGCTTIAALEAAHIGTSEGRDDNSLSNGILLRSDIHALFDRLLITLSSDGGSVDVSPELDDPSYEFLRSARVSKPTNAPPSSKSIQQHRKLFLERQKSRSHS